MNILTGDDMENIRERPTVSGKYTKEDLLSYANWRKDRAFKNIAEIAEDVKKGKAVDIYEHEEYREPLAVPVKEMKEITIQLSTGGDADGFKFVYEKDAESWQLKKAAYYWADWGVYEEVELSEEEYCTVSSFYGIEAYSLD